MEGYNRYITWRPTPLNSKIMQLYSKGLEYALVSPNYEQCHDFVRCKDFLHDIIYSTLNNSWFEVYKFKYNPVIDPNPCLDKVRLLLANSKDKNFEEKIPAVVDFVNQIEDKLKIKKSFARKCWLPPEEYRKNGIFLFEGSKRWLQAPPMLSLYSLLLRVGFCHTKGNYFAETIEGITSNRIKPYQKRDGFWLKSIEPAFEKIMKFGDRRIFHKDIQLNYPSKMKIDLIHNRLGIIGFATDIKYKLRNEPVLVPHWHYQK